MTKEALIFFGKDEHYDLKIGADDTITLAVDKDGSHTEYDVTGGGAGASGSFTLETAGFPVTMTKGETYQIQFTLSDGATMEFVSSAPSSKISIDENGLMTCIGNTTGFCGIDIKCYNSNGDIVGNVHARVTVK